MEKAFFFRVRTGPSLQQPGAYGLIYDSANAKTGKASQYTAVNLGDEDYQQIYFVSRLCKKATQQLIGTRFANKTYKVRSA
jgi:hypothetical protein